MFSSLVWSHSTQLSCNLLNCQFLYSSNFSFKILYRKLEQERILDPSSDFDIMCLHLCVGYFLSTTVDAFLDGWNRHPVRTEGNKTPIQLFYSGLIELSKDGLPHDELIQVNFVSVFHFKIICNFRSILEF